MFYVFNIIIIALVLLIAYWWANQGLFSGIIHLLCVIAAGAIALSVWEPLTVGLLLRGGRFDDYAWGITLVGVFVITLAILRVATNKIVPGNVAVPNWANWVFGLPVGAVSGILSLGILIIGCGFIQSTREIAGFVGAHRAPRGGQVGVSGDERMWLPVHEISYEFFGYLSVGSLSTGQPLKHYYPRLDWQAASLARDSWGDGKGKLALAPDDAQVQGVYFCEPLRRYAVKIHFATGARDWGEQLTLSRAQIRLISQPKDPMAEARVAYPDKFTQPVWGDPAVDDGHHNFDDVSHYISSVPGQESVDVVVEFNANDLGADPPRFLQIRGTRFRLPRIESIASTAFQALRSPVGSTATVTVDQSAPSIQNAVTIDNRIAPLQVSTNNMPPGIRITEVSDEKYFSDTGGQEVEFIPGGERPARALAIRGLFEPESTRMVKLDVSRESSANIFGPIRDRVTNSDTAPLMLVDSDGRTYSPVGYFYEKTDRKVIINLDYSRLFRTIDKLPQIPTSGGSRLSLLFTVTQGATITGFVWGDATVGRCNLKVDVTSRPVSTGGAPKE